MISTQLGHDGCHTLYEAFRRGVETNPLGPCLGFRAISSSGYATPYVYCSYSEVLARVDALAAGLQAMKLVEPNEDGMKLVRTHIFFFPLSLSRLKEKQNLQTIFSIIS